MSEVAHYRPDFSRSALMLRRRDRERLAFAEFRRRAIAHLLRTPANDWEFLALARHHGVPTRLLDWTESSLAALFFAVEQRSKNEGCVWCYCHAETQEYLNLTKEPSPLDTDRVVFYEPSHVDHRIATQSSVFTAHPENFKSQDSPWIIPPNQITIPASAKPRIFLELQRLGIHRASLFADLDGVGAHIYQKYRDD